jgi:hypothetical protein
MRLFATIAPVDLHPPSRHLAGFPKELNEGAPTALPWPALIVIHQKSDGVFLDRLTLDGETAGDTWHMSVDDAKDQAAAEYAGMLSKWSEVGDNVSDDELLRIVRKRAQ